MTNETIRQFSEIQSRLEDGFKECLKLTGNFTSLSEDSIRNRAGFSRLPSKEILFDLQRLCPQLYLVMANVLSRLVPLIQPEDFADERRLNFYFWPGYHSYLANKRVFVKGKEGNWNFGVGLFSDFDRGKIEQYHDCSQARWYHYLVPSRNKSHIVPGDVHKWLRLQQQPRFSLDPSVFETQKFVNSLTATTGNIDTIDTVEQQMFKGNEAVFLKEGPEGSLIWGELYASFINQYRVVKNWTFPDRWGHQSAQESRWRSLRCKMHSVWLHAAFRSDQPDWLEHFLRELLSDRETQPAGDALQQALNDKTAVDWGDGSRQRPNFTCWSYLSLHASLAPLVSPLHPSPPQAEEELQANLARQSLGSAELVSSIPLRPRYFSIVRPWISEVYGLLRNAEISILLENHKLEARRADLAGPFWAHELMKLTDEGLSTVQRDLGDPKLKAAGNTRFVLHSIRMLSSLAYLFTGPIFTGAQGAVRQREEVLGPLRRLHKEDRLIDALKYVAQQTYENLCADGPHVVFEVESSPGWKPETLRYPEQRSCFLLVSEMIRNYCESERDTDSATWKAVGSGSTITVTLTGTTRAQRNPTSMTLARLNVFLRALEIGSANVEWDKNQGMCQYKIEVDLAPFGASADDETIPAASKLPASY